MKVRDLALRSRTRRALQQRDLPVPEFLLEPVDQALRRHLRQVFAQRDVNLVVDVGARHGEYGRLIRQNGYVGRLVSFEPVSRSFRRLSERAAKDEPWKVMNMALGAKDEKAEINVTEDTFCPLSYSRTRARRPSSAERAVRGCSKWKR